jgi:predicted GIY-YIG superfamily endonuclease
MWLDDHRTALYRFFDEGGALLYVGITANLESRWLDHEREKPWWPQVVEKTVEWFDNRPAAGAAELEAIKAEHPVHNVSGTPAAHKRRELAPNEAGHAALRAQLSEYIGRARWRGEATVVVDGTRKQKRIAVLVSMDFYERALAVLGEVRVRVEKPDTPDA